ncbi:MAG: histidine kinase [Bacteroidota bacterium]
MSKKRIQYLGFDDKWFVLLGIPLLALFIPIAFFDNKLFYSDIPFVLIWLETLIHCATYWIGFRYFVIYIRKRFKGFQFTRKRVVYEVVFIILYGFIASFIIKGFVQFCREEADPHPVEALDGYVATYFSSFFILTIYEAIYLYAQNKKNIIETERLKREQIHSELQGLRNQVNPHFLFNSLNTLMNIIHEDQNLASSFLKKLSKVYRYILENRKENLISLEEELEFIESYVYLQKERFKNNLNVQIEISDNHLGYFVPPLSLQILFENAIKHNIISNKKPLYISAYINQDNSLVIKNNYQPKNQVMDSTGVGLENISSRLAYFTPKELKTLVENGEFIVEMPLVHQNIKL